MGKGKYPVCTVCGRQDSTMEGLTICVICKALPKKDQKQVQVDKAKVGSGASAISSITGKSGSGKKLRGKGQTKGKK